MPKTLHHALIALTPSRFTRSAFVGVVCLILSPLFFLPSQANRGNDLPQTQLSGWVSGLVGFYKCKLCNKWGNWGFCSTNHYARFLFSTTDHPISIVHSRASFKTHSL